MGNEVSLQKTPRSKPLRHPVSRVPGRLRREHPSAFDPQTLFLGNAHSDDDWNDSFDTKSLLIATSLNKSNDIVIGYEIWASLTDSLAKSETISKVMSSRIQPSTDANEKDSLQDSAKILNMLLPAFRGVQIIGDVVLLVSCFLKDLFINMDSLRAKYGDAAINDFVKLDNQLPLELVQAVISELPSALKNQENLVLKEFQMGFSEKDFPLIIHKFCQFYSPFRRGGGNADPLFSFGSLSSLIQNKKSILDCLHKVVTGESITESESSTTRLMNTESNINIPTAKEMFRSGIHFEPTITDNIAGIHFENGALRLPIMIIDEKTETVIRNLMVLESSYPEKPVTSYIRFLSEIAENGDDVAVLRKSGMLRGNLGKDDRVAEFIKSLDDSYYTPKYSISMEKALLDLQSYYNEKRRDYMNCLTLFTSSFILLGLLLGLIYPLLH